MANARILPLTIFTMLLSACSYWFDNGKAAAPPAVALEPSESPSQPRSPMPSGAPTLRLRGSATIGAALAPKLATAFLSQLGATDAAVAVDDREQNHAVVRGHVKGELTAIEIDYPGSATAFDGLVSGACDVGLASRPIQDEEIERLRGLGDMTSASAEHVLGTDGIAIIVNQGNRTTRLTVGQIGKIYLGEISNWSQVGGPPGAIHVYSRDKKSGTFDAFTQLALAGKALPEGRAKLFDDNESLAAAVTKDELGIGFVSLAYVGDTKPIAVQDGQATPSSPSVVTVGTEEYPFSRRLFLYVPEKSPTSLAKQFVEFALSEDGQRAVASSGFVPLTVKAQAVALPTDAPIEYAKAIIGAQRLSFNFRFKKSSANLDSKSQRDVERLARFVKIASSRPHTVSLFAFTDGDGNEARNVELSKQRARAVAGILNGKGVPTQVVEGFGPALPVASNDTKEGRRKNNRVEVWLQ